MTQEPPEKFAKYEPRSRGEVVGLPRGLMIRTSIVSDSGALARIRQQREGGSLEESVSRFQRDLTNHPNPPDDLWLTALIEDEIVGYGKVSSFTPAPDAPANTAPAGFYLGGVTIDRAHRRRGIGAELTRRRLEWIAQRANEAFYVANVRNRASIDLHARFGFVEVTRDFHVPRVTFEGGVGILFRAALCFVIAVLFFAHLASAQSPIVITGPEQSQLDLKLPNGGLPAAPGVTNIEVHHAQKGWTYNHHVDMAAWKGRLYVAWNTCEKDEDVWPSREMYATSSDGRTWSEPQELFPMGVSTALRMYFFHATNGRMLAIAGLRTSREDVDEFHKGGLVVREIRDDHSLGEVFTLRLPNKRFIGGNVPPMFSDQHGRDAHATGFIEACQQLLANKPFLEQQDYGTLLGDRKMKWHDSSTWPADEPSRAHFEKRFGKAMSFFHRKDGALVAVMKWGWVLVSRDEGETWTSPVRPPTLVAGMAKVWGQRTADGRYALFYNPSLSERFPLVQVTSDDGITFSHMRVINGEHSPMQYEGKYKAIGAQYVRGISEWSNDGTWKDEATWVVYSMSKEDIYVARVPVDGKQKD